MNQIKYIIPSYQRPEQFKNKTFKYLMDHDIPKDQIYVFVRSDDPDLNKYFEIKGPTYVVTDVKGIGRTHNYISAYFNEGEFIVEIDDDLEDIIDNQRSSVLEFAALCAKMFHIMTYMGVSYGGTYQCDNPMFMSQNGEFSTDLKYMLGCLRFRFIRKEIVLDTNYAEDMENCIRHYIRDGKILKNNWIAPVTKNYVEGGCDGDGRNVETEKQDKEVLSIVYPQYCKLFQRKNGKWDLKLRHDKRPPKP
jgi:hypothetical protein